MTWVPTRKWIAATITAAVGLAVMLLTGDRGTVSDPEIVAIGTFVTQRAVAYLLPNAP